MLKSAPLEIESTHSLTRARNEFQGVRFNNKQHRVKRCVMIGAKHETVAGVIGAVELLRYNMGSLKHGTDTNPANSTLRPIALFHQQPKTTLTGTDLGQGAS